MKKRLLTLALLLSSFHVMAADKQDNPEKPGDINSKKFQSPKALTTDEAVRDLTTNPDKVENKGGLWGVGTVKVTKIEALRETLSAYEQQISTLNKHNTTLSTQLTFANDQAQQANKTLIDFINNSTKTTQELQGQLNQRNTDNQALSEKLIKTEQEQKGLKDQIDSMVNLKKAEEELVKQTMANKDLEIEKMGKVQQESLLKLQQTQDELEENKKALKEKEEKLIATKTLKEHFESKHSAILECELRAKLDKF